MPGEKNNDWVGVVGIGSCNVMKEEMRIQQWCCWHADHTWSQLVGVAYR